KPYEMVSVHEGALMTNEVRKVRHKNVVWFIGARTKPPSLTGKLVYGKKWFSKISELRILASAYVAVLSFSPFNDKRTHAYNLQQLRAMVGQNGVAKIPWML
ncbi:hypothetical protein Tco_1433695, partial [Tanacetum coccineum]